MGRLFRILLSTCAIAAIVAVVGCSGRPTAGPSAGAGAAASGLKRFIFLTNGDDPFWDACNAGLIEGGKRYDLASKGLRAVMEKNNGTAQGQIEKLRQFGSQGDIAGVAISVIQSDNAAIVEEMKALAAKGVLVITVDGDVNREKFRDARPWYIGTDNIEGGRLLGRAAAKLLEARGLAEGGYVQFAGFTDNDNARSRMNGFKEAVGSRFREIDRMSDEMDLAKARDNVRASLVNHPDVAALVGIWAYNAPAIAEVVEERGVRRKTTIVTFDAQAAAIELMAAGRIDAMVVQHPFDMGMKAVRLLLAMHEKDSKTIDELFPEAGKPDGDLHTTGLRLVIPDAAAASGDRPASPLSAGDFERPGIEVVPLSRFREWLRGFGLASS